MTTKNASATVAPVEFVEVAETEATVEVAASTKRPRAPRSELTRARHALTGATMRLESAKSAVAAIEAEIPALTTRVAELEAADAVKTADVKLAQARMLQAKADEARAELEAAGIDTTGI